MKRRHANADWIDAILDAGADVEEGSFALVLRRLQDNTCTHTKTYPTLRAAIGQATRMGNATYGEAGVAGYAVERRGNKLILWISTVTFLRRREVP